MSHPQITLHGYRFSVYTRIVKLVLAEKMLDHACVEVDPFKPEVQQDLLRLHPFGHVPVLTHAGFTLHETAAITRYLDAAFPVPCLTPSNPAAVARMQQVICIVDAHGYRALVRQVFANLVFRPLEGFGPDMEEVRRGL